MKITIGTVSAGVGILAVVLSAGYGTTSWIISRASADDIKQVEAAVAQTARAATSTAKSVEGLTLIVYQDKLDHAVEELAVMRSHKRATPVTWDSEAEADLLRLERRVETLTTEIDRLLAEDDEIVHSEAIDEN